MPSYVQRQFRLKAMGLMCLQLLVVIGIMFLADGWNISDAQASGVFLSLLSFLIVMLLLLGSLKAVYPLNYILLAIVTMLAGLAWGIGGSFLPDAMHFQIISIISVAMVIALVMTVLLSAMEWNPRDLMVASLVVGGAVGVAADAVFAPMLGSVHEHVMVSAATALLLLCVFAWEAGPLLIECNPDTFMTVIVAMDASLLAVVSLPFVWVMAFGFLIPCCMTGGEEEAAPRTARAGAGAAGLA
mmetsp:Transcript_29345/g.58584  ORF Transcript_29345/g.58584 Transcript_29345/m.58584 type:complete len:243 (+) Transcript_29345:2-730(+)